MNSRIGKVQAGLAPDTSLLITHPLNIRYLCGFTGSFGYLLVGPTNCVLFTDSRYAIQSNAETTNIDIEIGRSVLDFLRDKCKTQHLVLEGDHVSVNFYNKVDSLSQFTCAAQVNTIEDLRRVKDSHEISLLARAGEITTQALAELIQQDIVGLSEKEIAKRLDRLMVDLGAEAAAFDTIVATGTNSAIPHHQPTTKIFEQGDLLKVDFGAQYAGYKSDCTRTFVAGTPSAFQLDLHQTVTEAQAAGRAAVHDGLTARELDVIVREHVKDHEYCATFQHGLGHGVGLAIHEDPFLSANNDTRLTTGTVITIEPGMYVEARGGVRIEDTIVITADGYRNLTEFSYDLISL